MEKEIFSKGKKYIVLFDEEDCDLLIGKLHLHTQGYAQLHTWNKTNKKTDMKLFHRVIMSKYNNINNKLIDHINHNKLDNRKCNLRICNKSQNMMNQIKQSKTSSNYKGVW